MMVVIVGTIILFFLHNLMPALINTPAKEIQQVLKPLTPSIILSSYCYLIQLSYRIRNPLITDTSILNS